MKVIGRQEIPDNSPEASRTTLLRWTARLEGALWVAAAVLLGTVTWTLGDAYLFQRRAEARLESEWQAAAPAAAASTHAAPRGWIVVETPLARLSIPRLGTSAIVAEGVGESVLRRALGHLPRSARPGENGNIVLAGHRDTFFRALEGVEVGEELQLDSAAGRDRYRVEWAAVVEPRQIAITQPSGYPALTLVTCYPFGYLGDAPYRYVVRARRVERGPTAGRGIG